MVDHVRSSFGAISSILLIAPLAFAGDCDLGAPVFYAAGDFPSEIVAEDFDGDGVLDLAVANVFGNSISVLLGHGDGTFAAQTANAVGQGPLSFAAGDLDGDGDVDLVSADAFSQSATVLLNAGDGTFAKAGMTPIAGGFPQGIALGDLDGDGDLDAVLNAQDLGIVILLGHGTGAFGAPDAHAATNGTSIALGDVDDDGDLDLVQAHSLGASLFRNGGAGALGAEEPLDGPVSGDGPRVVRLGDVTGDGALDVVYGTSGNPPGESIVVVANLGDGTFGDAASSIVNGGFNVALGDYDGDGDLDVLSSAFISSDELYVHVNDGTGTFTEEAFLPFSTFCAIFADLDDDGVLDIANAAQSDDAVSIWLSSCPGGCPYDLTGDLVVTTPDLLLLLSTWGECVADCDADLDGSGDVGFTDLLIILTEWGPCP